MRRPLLATAAVLTLTVLIPSPTLAHAQSNQQNEPSAQESAPDVPDAIAVPAGLGGVLIAVGGGVRLAVNRRRITGWERAWRAIGPQWSRLS